MRAIPGFGVASLLHTTANVGWVDPVSKGKAGNRILNRCASHFALGTSHLALLPFRLLVHVSDGLLVDDHVGAAVAYDLQAIAVVPFDDAVHALAVLEHDNHRRLRLHLL